MFPSVDRSKCGWIPTETESIRRIRNLDWTSEPRTMFEGKGVGANVAEVTGYSRLVQPRRDAAGGRRKKDLGQSG